MSLFKTWLVLIAILVSSLGCGGGVDPQTDLVGKWTLDKEATKAALTESGNEMASMLSNMVDGMELAVQFNADKSYEGSTVAMGKTTNFSGDWNVIEESPDSITVETKDEGKDNADRRKITFVNKDLIIFDSGTSDSGGGLVPRLRRN